MHTTVQTLEGSRQQLFIDGQFTAPHSNVYVPSYDPTTGRPWYEFAQADAVDVDRAVRCAQAALVNPAWRRMTQTERGKLVRKLGELVLANAEALAAIECRDNGKLLKEMRAQMRAIPDSYSYFAGMADKLQGDTIPVNKLDTLNFNTREPIGVVGMIIPWNSPLMMLTGTLAPCLAIGNTIVVKPSEHATASTLALAELAIEAGIPPGVVNVVTGDGMTTAKAVGAKLGIDEVHGEVKPADKLALVSRLQAEGRVVAMAGDGINDAPALAKADVGIAMGTGTDVAMNSAQVTLVKGDLRGISTARELSEATVGNMKQNLMFAFLYNALGIPIAAGLLYPFTGWLLSPMIAALAMSLSSASVIANALRLRKG